MSLSRRSLVFAPLLLFGGCSGPISVTVTGDDGTPIFHVTGISGGPTYVSFLSVSRLRRGSDPVDMWTFSNPNPQRLEVHARYGKAPKGFNNQTPAQPLERNVEYYVDSAGGPGFGSATFRIDDGGRVI